MLILFLVAFGAIAYVYFGYPLLLAIMARRTAHQSTQSTPSHPRVSMIIPAYNEEAVIEQKIQNTLALRYPRDRLEIIVTSDGSTDRTDEIIMQYTNQGVRFHRMPVRQGKFPAIASAAADAEGDIFVFSDANAMYEPDALTRLVEPFQDERVGCVCGKLLYVNRRGTSISDGETLYWNYENRLKHLESRFNSLIGANGSIYAIRRAAYVPLDPDLSDDYGLPLAAYAKGYRIVYQPSAVSREEAPVSIRSEFKKKCRFVSHQLTTLARLWPMLRPFHDPKFCFQVVSHKLLRTIVPLLLILLFLSNALLDAPLARVLLWGQIGFYGLAVCGLLLYRRGVNLKVFAIPLYFCTVNAAAAVGIVQFLLRVNYAAWDEKE